MINDMLINDFRNRINNVPFSSMVCQTDINTDADIESYAKKGFGPLLTSEKMKDTLKVDPSNVYYVPGSGNSCVYFNKETLAACRINVLFLLCPEMFHSDTPYPEEFPALLDKVETEVANHKYSTSAFELNDAARFEYLNLVVKKEHGAFPGLYELFLDIYSDSDFGYERIEPETWNRILESKTPKDVQATREKLDGLPQKLTVYRGGSSVSLPYTEAFSWTLDINVANFFATYKCKEPGYIAVGEVDCNDIIEYLPDDRNEKEVIVLPSKVKVSEVITLPGMESITNLPSDIIHTFVDYCDNMECDVEFSFDSEEHAKRVLLLSLMLSEQLELSAEDKKALATAAIYHDARRESDDYDSMHGEKARKYYHETVSDPDPLVEFLCQYHCLPDDEGYAKIADDPQLSVNMQRVTTLYNVFKDANELDKEYEESPSCIRQHVDQLRLEVSKSLSLVAHILRVDWEEQECVLLDSYADIEDGELEE